MSMGEPVQLQINPHTSLEEGFAWQSVMDEPQGHRNRTVQ